MTAHSKTKKILLVEGPGGFIRLDRCMQSVNSWGGVYRFPLNLARIAAHLLHLGMDVRFIDMQADKNANLLHTLNGFCPDLCILSSGFPSLKVDGQTALTIKEVLPTTHVSAFGVAPTLLDIEFDFFHPATWSKMGLTVPFDSIVVGGEPALGYEQLIAEGLEQHASRVIRSKMEKTKSIRTYEGRKLFNHDLYRSPFTGEVQTYIEGSYGCPHECNFCVVPQLYGKKFAKRTPDDIVNEFVFVIENNGVKQISLWDEGTTFQRTQIKEICNMLIEVRKSNIPELRNFAWNTRSTTNLLDEEIVHLMKQSGMSGITLGLESFDEVVLESTGKGTTVENNLKAIKLLKAEGIISIGHIVLGLPQETVESAQRTIQGVIDSGLDIAQFYCAVPYPGTPLYTQALEADLIQVNGITNYELCNPIMDTLGGLNHQQVGMLRRQAMQRFYEHKKIDLNMLKSSQFADWASR